MIYNWLAKLIQQICASFTQFTTLNHLFGQVPKRSLWTYLIHNLYTANKITETKEFLTAKHSLQTPVLRTTVLTYLRGSSSSSFGMVPHFQMLAVMVLSQHRVSTSKTVSPRIPVGARCTGHVRMMCSAVCSAAPHSQFDVGARPNLCMND